MANFILKRLFSNPILPPVLLIIVIVIAYANSLGHNFVWDDHEIIVNNPLLSKLSNFPKIFLSEDRFVESSSGYYRPITYMSFLLEKYFWGNNPLGFNITNLVLYIVVTLLLYYLVYNLFKKENLALATALIFSLHPIAGETVNFHAGGRNTLLCAVFALLAYLFYLKRRQIPSLACFAVAILSKEFALLLPALFIINDRILKNEKRRWHTYVPYLVLVIGYLILRSLVVANGNLFATARFAQNLLSIPQLVSTYVINLVYPFNLKVFYDLDISTGSQITGFLILTALVAAVLFFRKNSETTLASGWFLLFLLPVLNIFPLGITAVADRYAFFSLMGFSLALASIICSLREKVIIPVIALLCCTYVIIDIKRNDIWNNDTAFYQQMIHDAPSVVHGYQNLGMKYYSDGDLVNAEKYLSIATSKKNVRLKTLTALAGIYGETGREDSSLALLLRAEQSAPNNPQILMMIGNTYKTIGKMDLAQTYFSKANTLFPGLDKLLNQRVVGLCSEGEKLMAENKMVEAEVRFREALLTKPDFIPALIDLGSLKAEKGDFNTSAQYLVKASTLAPLNPAIHHNLSMVYESMGKIAEARAEMARFRELEAVYRKKGTASQ